MKCDTGEKRPKIEKSSFVTQVVKIKKKCLSFPTHPLLYCGIFDVTEVLAGKTLTYVRFDPLSGIL